VEGRMRRHPQIRLLDNPRRITPAAMNIGVRESGGEVVIILNAHARIGTEFIGCSVQTLREHPEADAVGGTLASVSEGGMGEAIAAALNSPLGAGGRRYRTRTEAGPIRDTVPYAAYRREVFERVGLIDEELIRNQDAEFNYRLLRMGGRIYFDPEIRSFVNSRDSVGRLARQQFQTGYWKVLLFQKVFLRTNWRHLVPAAFVGATAAIGVAAVFSKRARWLLALDLGAYAAALIASSVLIGVRRRLKSWFLLPYVFSVIHASYGAGMLKGFWDFVILRDHRRRRDGFNHGRRDG
ncbi:MAG: hypothetical protein L0177_16895, partial [Chloroflexi bacterium]|nr:hypothetical protein [Chloroflexota bacterium]